MRVVLLTTGRFWLVDLGRELAALGHDVRVYSLVPPHLTGRFQLPDHCNHWLGKYVAPVYGMTKLPLRGYARELAEHALLAAVDQAAAAVLEPCDVFVSISGVGVRALDVARRRFGAKVFVERASRHILSQRQILEAIPGASRPVPDFAIGRELTGYGLADVVTVPATHVKESFLERGFPEERLFVNPFGTSLDSFQATPWPERKAQPTILTVGAWSLRKGCDVLVAAWRKLKGTRLLHVGPVVDAPLPLDEGFEHVDAVPQHELTKYYAQAHVFALASREEGLALVQVQALASGLKLVCTDRTGGADLAQFVADPSAIRVVPVEDVNALAAALREALATVGAPGTARDLLGERREQVSWAIYAQRYLKRMEQELARP